MRMTDKEKAIINFLAGAAKKGHDRTDMEGLGRAVYGPETIGERPKNWKQAMASTTRNLGAKLAREGCRFRRVSQLGRGHKAIFEFKGDFEKVLRS